MSERSLNSYKGTLTPADVARGMNAAAANALRLIEDAETLLEAQRFPSAASLAILSIEESGKVSILRQIATATSKDEVRDSWKSYRTHTRKNVQWLLPQLALSGARRLDDLKPLFDAEAKHPAALDAFKQLGFYTDCLDAKQWSIPAEAVGEELARTFVQIARLSVPKHEVSTLEVELWVEHVGGAPRGDLEASKRALILWYGAMQQAGLRPMGVNEMQRFINEGVPFPGV